MLHRPGAAEPNTKTPVAVGRNLKNFAKHVKNKTARGTGLEQKNQNHDTGVLPETMAESKPRKPENVCIFQKQLARNQLQAA